MLCYKRELSLGSIAYSKWLAVSNPDELLKGDNVEIENRMLAYIDHATQVEKLASGSIRMKISALKLFFEMNRRPLSWKPIGRTIEDTGTKKDRAPIRRMRLERFFLSATFAQRSSSY